MLVSIITPTTLERVEFNERIKSIVGAQDYPEIEHIMCYDLASVGAKRNTLCEKAKGTIIVHMDSDDIYAPDWVSRSVEHLLRTKSHVTGLSSGYFFDPYKGKAWMCKTSRQYPMGATLAYYKSIWQRNKFPDMRKGEDTDFCRTIKNIKVHDYKEGFVATIHGFNTSSHEMLPKMTPISASIPENIINLAYNTM